MIAVKKDILSRTNLVSHPYCMILDIWKLNPQFRKYLRRTRVVNLYDNKIGKRQLWKESCLTICQAIQDIYWKSIIQGRILIVEDINAHNPMWNPHCCQKQNASLFAKLIKTYKLLVNNNIDFPIRLGS